MSEITLGFKKSGFQQVSQVIIPDVFYHRFTTGIQPFDELLGGQGFLPGSTFTVTGKPGAGKTTFLLQMLEALQVNGKLTGYASGEESVFQIAYNSKRLQLTQVQIANMTDVDELCAATEHLDVLIVDSFQFLSCTHITKPIMLQRYAVKQLVEASQRNQCVIGIIQHLTSTGIAKGGTLVPHAVDMNMEIITDDDDSTLKTISVYKNRFGRCGEISLLMGDKGFDFNHVVERQDSPKMTKAIDRGEKEKKEILDYINEKGSAVITELFTAIGESWRVQHYLRILTNENQITKEGRGAKAVWKKATQIEPTKD